MARGSRRLVSQRGNGRLNGRTHQREMRARARRRSVPSQGELGRGESGIIWRIWVVVKIGEGVGLCRG